MLEELGRSYGTDKVEHGYLPYYERYLPDPVARVRLLEIGIFRDDSLKMWGAYFPNGEVIGVDIDSRFAINERNISSWIGDVKSFEPIGTYDVVVDDGSHDPIDVQVAHAIVWPHVASGGLYVVEDLREEALGTIDEPLRGLFRRADLAEMFVHPSEVLYPWRQQIVFMRKT